MLALQNSDEEPDDPGRWWRRTTISDAISLGSQLAVLNTSGITVIGGIAPVLWRTADTWMGLDSFVQIAVDELGEHPEAASLIETALEELREQGLLAYRDVAG